MPHKEGFKKIIKEYLPYDKQNIYGIEIGCYKGEFCKALLKEFGNLEMVTIDPRPIWIELISSDKVSDRLWILNFPSDIAKNFITRTYDFVFIDGDHSYEQCRKDIIHYLPFVKKGGIISGHNYHKRPESAHPGVHQAVDEIFGDKVKIEADFIWYVQI